jgi:hypothetical protein
METLKARVRNGRLVVEQPVNLPEGTELDLVVADPGDDLDDAERAELHAALADAWASTRAGNVRSADELLRELRAK